MRIRIINSNPKKVDESDITKYIGQEFDVIEKEDDGSVWVKTPKASLYHIYNDEFEIVEGIA